MTELKLPPPADGVPVRLQVGEGRPVILGYITSHDGIPVLLARVAAEYQSRIETIGLDG